MISKATHAKRPAQGLSCPGASPPSRLSDSQSGGYPSQTSRSDASPGGPERATELVAWYRRVRRDLPWRRTRDPYAIWISETMLQQTRVDTVIPYFERFMNTFPTVQSLASAPLDSVLREWSGLGYYRRARFLHEGASQLVQRHDGKLPEHANELAKVKGIGPYTAGAVASIAYGKKAALVDGNVHRVLARFYGDGSEVDAARKQAWVRAAELVAWSDAPGDFNQGLMELGATVCGQTPQCESCPWAASCVAHREGTTAEIPRAKVRARVRDEAFTTLVVVDSRKRIWVCRRRSALRFGGMWEPPMLPDQDLAAFSLFPEARTMGSLLHKLTHRNLHVRVQCVQDAKVRVKDFSIHAPLFTGPLGGIYDESVLATPEMLAELAWSTLARKTLALAGITLAVRT
jgi:A/G-specific adenine glycosylase